MWGSNEEGKRLILDFKELAPAREEADKSKTHRTSNPEFEAQREKMLHLGSKSNCPGGQEPFR